MSQAEEGVITWHWRNTMKPVRFFKFDARAGATLLLVLVHVATWTLTVAILVNTLFWILERKGLTLPSAIRAFRCWVFGNYRPPFLWTVRRKLHDSGSV